MVAVLVFKNFRLGVTCNAFDQKYHGLGIKNRNHKVVASNLRLKLARSREKKTDITRDRWFHVRVLNYLSKCKESEKDQWVVTVANMLLDEHWMRFQYFLDNGFLSHSLSALLIRERDSREDKIADKLKEQLKRKRNSLQQRMLELAKKKR